MRYSGFLLTVMIVIVMNNVSSFAFPSLSSSLLDGTVSLRWKNSNLQRRMSVKKSSTVSFMISSALSIPRSGSLPLKSSISSALLGDPSKLFDSILVILGVSAFATKAADRLTIKKSSSTSQSEEDKLKPSELKSLQRKYLAAFWLLRCGYWMSGPYVVPAYKSKIFGGVEASMGLVSKIFLSGFAATAILGPSIGQATDTYGRKAGTMMFALLYGIGCASIKSNALWVLFAGRAIIGCALSLLFTAPEAWVNSEASRTGLGANLGEIFGLAYTGDALVAIIAGKLASWAASIGGMTGPFDLATIFLAAGGLVAGVAWKENKASISGDKKVDEPKGGSMMEALEIVRKDRKLVLVGAVQSLFEASMNIFILQWPLIVSQAVRAVFGDTAAVPFGTIFSCFMTCSLLGSLWFGKSVKYNSTTETTAAVMLAVSSISMILAGISVNKMNLSGILVALLAYEACVGMYFPVIGTLRSKLIPNDKKTVIMSLFGVPLNTLVVISYLFIGKMGMTGSMGVAAGALSIATVCMMKLRSIVKEESVAA